MRSRWLAVVLTATLLTVVGSAATAQDAEIRAVQRELQARGFEPGPVDGLMGPLTREALREFQAQSGLPPTGKLDDETRQRLLEKPDPKAPDTIEPAAAEREPKPAPAQRPSSTSDTGDAVFWWSVAAVAAVVWLVRRSQRRAPSPPAGDASPSPRAVRARREPTVTREEGGSRTPDRDPSPSAALRIEIDAPATPARRRSTRSPASKSGQSLWVPAGQSRHVAGHDIGAMVYVGKGLRSERFGEAENCLIDPSLPVAKQRADISGEHLPYWPSYTRIPPTSRLAYLQWLAGGRQEPAFSVGYVFLYFYGLERRLLVDRPDVAEQRRIVAEVERLRALYGASRSFDRYSRELLEAAIALRPEEADRAPLLERSGGWQLPLSVRIGLAQRIGAGQPLSGEWMLSWWLNHPETRLRTPAHRAFAEFKELFLLRFRERYPDGLTVRAPKRQLTYTYRAASGTFERRFDEELAPYADVSGLKKPLSIAEEIADTCMDELAAYSRFLGKNPNGRDTVQAYALLPGVLADRIPSRVLDDLRCWANATIERDKGIVAVEQLLERLEGTAPERINRRALTSAADALARVGIGLAPDPRFALRPAKAGEPIVLFRLPPGTRELDEVSAAYPAALTTLTLGVLVAQADGHVSEPEKRKLLAHVERFGHLSEAERVRLRANLDWLLVVPPSLQALRKRFEALDAAQRQALGRTAIAVAAADDFIDATEVKAIQSIYRTLGQPEDAVFAELHAASMQAQGPVTVRPADETPSGYAIPAPPKDHRERTRESGIALDHERVSAILADTARVSHILGDIFTAEAAEEEPADTDAAEPDDTGATLLSDLDPAHRPLVEELITHPSWSEAEFAELAAHFGLLADGARETINEWAFERFDEALVEEDEALEINPDIAARVHAELRGESDATTQH